jgi:hypothetical protein
MYNEDDQLFLATMNSVIKNIAHLCSRSKSKMWGPEGWKKVVVCVVSDGRLKIHPRVLKVLGAMGVYQVSTYATASARYEMIVANACLNRTASQRRRLETRR